MKAIFPFFPMPAIEYNIIYEYIYIYTHTRSNINIFISRKRFRLVVAAETGGRTCNARACVRVRSSSPNDVTQRLTGLFFRIFFFFLYFFASDVEARRDLFTSPTDHRRQQRQRSCSVTAAAAVEEIACGRRPPENWKTRIARPTAMSDSLVMRLSFFLFILPVLSPSLFRIILFFFPHPPPHPRCVFVRPSIYPVHRRRRSGNSLFLPSTPEWRTSVLYTQTYIFLHGETASCPPLSIRQRRRQSNNKRRIYVRRADDEDIR